MSVPRDRHFKYSLKSLYDWLDLSVRPAPLIGFRADLGGFNQAGIVDSEPTKVNFTHEAFDVGGKYDADNARWTPGAGLAHMSAQVLGTGDLSGGGNGVVQAIIYKNGNALVVGTQRVVVEGINTVAPINVVDLAEDGDFYELWTLALLVADTATVNGIVSQSYFSGMLTAA